MHNSATPANPEQSDIQGDPVFSSPLFELWMQDQTDDCCTISKRLPVSYRQDRERIDQFEREHAYFSLLDHSGFPNYERVSPVENDPVFQFSLGGACSLQALIDTSLKLKCPIPLSIGASLLGQILDTLSFFDQQRNNNQHGCNFLELNPATIFIDARGGIVVSHAAIGQPPSLTMSIIRLSERSYFIYAAPEQCVRGREPGQISSTYTLGMISFELLTGQRLYSVEVSQLPDVVIRRKVRNLHPLVSDVRADLTALDPIISAMLHPIPGQRLTDYGKLSAKIEQLVVSDQVDAQETFENFSSKLKSLAAKQRNHQHSGDIDSQLTQVTDITELNAS